MKLVVLTCGHFPPDEVRNKLWIFLRSCDKFGITPNFYRAPGEFPGYRQLMLDWQLVSLKTMKTRGVTHVLFTDGWDAFFCTDMGEILSKYLSYGSPPILCSAYIGLGNESDMSKYVGCFDESIPYRYPNRGGYIAETDAIIEAYERMLKNEDLTGDDCMEWYRGWREGWFRPKLDSECQIFQVSDVNATTEMTTHGIRLKNTLTNSEPCVFHLSGGYTDPVTGKDERMIPWARALSIL